jgi:apolipoprotein N-acyltransferase
MRQWMEFSGGVLVGLGLGVFVFFGMTVWWMHHMFIIGISNWPALLLTLTLPFILMILGFALAILSRRGRNNCG